MSRHLILSEIFIGMAETWSYNTCLLRVNHSLLFIIIGMYVLMKFDIYNIPKKRYYTFNVLNFVKFILNIISRICTGELFFQPLLAKVYALNFLEGMMNILRDIITKVLDNKI